MNNNATNKAQDVGSFGALYQRVTATGVTRPWGSPEGITSEGAAHRSEVVSQLLKLTIPLLDTLQADHREGHLDPDDIETLNQLQVWYAKLHAEAEHAKVPAGRSPSGTVDT